MRGTHRQIFTYISISSLFSFPPFFYFFSKLLSNFIWSTYYIYLSYLSPLDCSTEEVFSLSFFLFFETSSAFLKKEVFPLSLEFLAKGFLF